MEKSNWTGLAVVGSRSLYPEVRGRDELDRPGVYVLRGSADDNPSRPRIYVGEADVVKARLDSHLKQKDWWDEFVVFSSKDENLNKAYIRYLESRLVGIAQKLKRAQLENSTSPQPPRLAEADSADAEGFLVNMRLIYPLLGIDAFEEPRVVESGQTERPLLRIDGGGARATGRDFAQGFVVYERAIARASEVPSIPNSIAELRAQLLAEGVLAPATDGLVLTQDYTFTSPSAAAGALLGHSANGRIEWHDEQGRTLKELQTAAVSEIEEQDS